LGGVRPPLMATLATDEEQLIITGKETMKIDYLIIGSTGAGAIASEVKLAMAFERAGYSAAIASHWAPAHRAVLARSVQSFDLETPMREVQLSEQLDEAIRQMESRLSIPSIRDFCFPESRYAFVPTQALFARAVRTFLITERFLDEHKIGAIVTGPGAEIPVRCFLEAARKRGIPMVYMAAALGLFSDRMFLHAQEHQVLEDYRYIPYDDIEPRERTAIHELLEDIRDKRRVLTQRNRDINDRALGHIATVLSHFRRKDWHRLYVTWQFYVHNRVYAAIRGIAARAFYRRFDPNCPYVFFPLHLYNDSQISVRNPHMFQQTWIVEYLARSLPQGYKLYVKGHPGCPQDRLRNLAAMARLENVVLLDPSVNAHKIAMSARAVAVINSTAGAEALIHRKPVIALGNWELKHLGITFDVDDLSNLARIVRDAIDSPPIDESKLCSVFYSIRQAMYPGNIFAREPEYDTVANSLIRKVSLVRSQIALHADNVIV